MSDHEHENWQAAAEISGNRLSLTRKIAMALNAKDAEIERLRTDCADYRADAIRLHGDKMAYYEAALALVHSETIKNVCGWYPEIEAFRKLLGMAAAVQQGTVDTSRTK